jgi:hypothetical protein
MHQADSGWLHLTVAAKLKDDATSNNVTPPVLLRVQVSLPSAVESMACSLLLVIQPAVGLIVGPHNSPAELVSLLLPATRSASAIAA